MPLKSGCFDGATTSSACATLLAQAPVLEDRIDAAAQGPTPVIVLADFNSGLTQSNKRVWAELDDGEPANADLTTVTQDMPISGRDTQVPECIDHIVVDLRVVPWVDRTSFRLVTYRQGDNAVWETRSHHCPVVVERWMRSRAWGGESWVPSPMKCGGATSAGRDVAPSLGEGRLVVGGDPYAPGVVAGIRRVVRDGLTAPTCTRPRDGRRHGQDHVAWLTGDCTALVTTPAVSCPASPRLRRGAAQRRL